MLGTTLPFQQGEALIGFRRDPAQAIRQHEIRSDRDTNEEKHLGLLFPPAWEMRQFTISRETVRGLDIDGAKPRLWCAVCHQARG